VVERSLCYYVGGVEGEGEAAAGHSCQAGVVSAHGGRLGVALIIKCRLHCVSHRGFATHHRRASPPNGANMRHEQTWTVASDERIQQIGFGTKWIRADARHSSAPVHAGM
jgi:hypothetical protein